MAMAICQSITLWKRLLPVVCNVFLALVQGHLGLLIPPVLSVRLSIPLSRWGRAKAPTA